MPDNQFTDIFNEADDAFNSGYKKELDALKGLSEEEICSVIPKTADQKIYSTLIQVVEKASKDNLSQAQLIENIKDLGEVAVQLAKKVPQLALLF